MNEMDRSKYSGLDEKILDRHAEDTIREDLQMFRYQLENHLAHVIMLTEREIIERRDGAAILEALMELWESGPEMVGRRPGLTDLYSNVEEWMIERIGLEMGGRMHTGRSRNDMNLTIERMFVRESILKLCEAVTYLMNTLLAEADRHKETVIPGYTHHSQHAQPITLGHMYMGLFSSLTRDMRRLLDSYDCANKSPMGGAALAGTGFPVDRERTAELLGFDEVLINTIDATSSLDFAYEAASAMAIFINNVGRFTESLLLWNIREVGICRLDLKYCSYSTIMPQKRNPVALETLRYSGEWTYGALSTMLNAMKAYTPGNGREPGCVVSLYMEIAQKMEESAYLLEGIIRTLQVDADQALRITKEGFSTMTDLADEMVRSKGLSFSAAKKIVGRLVVMAQEMGIPCEGIDPDLVKQAARTALDLELDMPQELINNALDPWENVRRRNTAGGPNPVRVAETIESGYQMLDGLSRGWMGRAEKINDGSQRLCQLARQMISEVANVPK